MLENINVLAVLQARTSSTRLPGKVLKPLEGKPMLAQQINRINAARHIDKLIVATSDHSSDDELATCLQNLSIPCYRGSLDDVLDRYYQAVNEINPLHVVRLTGDCPLADPDVIDKVVATHLHSEADYTANVSPPTYPDGLDVEIMKFSVLEQVWRDASSKPDREHVTLYIRSNAKKFILQNVTHSADLSELRWTVDEPEDFAFVEEIYKALYKKNVHFGMSEILQLLDEQPELSAINASFERNEGLKKSIGES